MVADTDEIALLIGDTEFSSLSAQDQLRINSYIAQVEAKLASPPYNFQLSASEITEYLPASGGKSLDEPELGNYELTSSGMAAPIDSPVGFSVLSLSRSPVLLDGLQVWEDMDAHGGQADGAFGASTLLAEGVDYFLDVDVPGLSSRGAIHRITGGWSNIPRSIKVSYKSGPLAQQAADLGGEFLTVLKSVINNSAVSQYLFWLQQQQALTAGNAGRVQMSESIGKHSESFTAIDGFGSSPDALPGGLASQLSPFVSVASLLNGWG